MEKYFQLFKISLKGLNFTYGSYGIFMSLLYFHEISKFHRKTKQVFIERTIQLKTDLKCNKVNFH